MMADNPTRRIPAAQHVFDPGLDSVAVMRRVGVVHRDDVRRHRGADHVVVVGDDAHPGRALDQKAGMSEKGQPDRTLGDPADEVQQPLAAGDHTGACRLRR